MPHTSSNLTVCPYPFTCDVYEGCTHRCKYCFANARLKTGEREAFQRVKRGESLKDVEKFVGGYRTERDSWCDWDVPIRFGANSDPFQPCEKKEGVMLSIVKLLAQKGYPFLVTTKGATLAASPDYLSVLKDCNCVIQISMSSPLMDPLEPGAPTYEDRLRAVEALAKAVPRVMVRWQPFLLEHTSRAVMEIPRLKDAGAHGVLVETLFGSRFKVGSLQIKNGSRWYYPREDLERCYSQIKAQAHKNGLLFACSSIRKLSDCACCCTGDDMPGWIPNKCNALYYYLRPTEFAATERQRQIGTGDVFNIVSHDRANLFDLKHKTFLECMTRLCKTEITKENMMY